MPNKMHTDRLAYLVAELHRFVHTGLEGRLQQYGSSVEQWRVLEALEGRNGCSMGELASAVLMNHPALTKMIDRMVSNGLVHRVPDPTDQRRVLVYSTDRGTVLVGKLRPVVHAHEETLGHLLGDKATREIRAILNDVSGSLRELA